MPFLPTTSYAVSTPAAHPASINFMRYMLGFGLPGLLFISIVDSSPIPLPIPGSTDILIILLAARTGHWLLLAALATAGSIIGGYISYHAGKAGGMRVLERYVSKRYLKRITEWMEHHSIIAVALPAILPPPMPLTAFMLAAGALKISLRRYMVSFTISRALRHGLCGWLGVHYGRHIVHAWNHFYARWGTTMLIVIIVLIAVSIGVPIYAMWREAQARKKSGQPGYFQEISSTRPRRTKPAR